MGRPNSVSSRCWMVGDSESAAPLQSSMAMPTGDELNIVAVPASENRRGRLLITATTRNDKTTVDDQSMYSWAGLLT